MELLRFMQWHWPQKDSQIGHIALMSSKALHADALTAPLLRHKLLKVGSAPNGDFFVIDFSTDVCVPGFVSHEEYWKHEDSPRNVFQPIARSLESLLYRIAENRYIPTELLCSQAVQ